MKRILSVLPAFALSACVVGPNYVKPTTPVPAQGGAFAEAGIGKGIAPTPLPDHWWRLYNDPVVDRLVADALAHNTDVRVAAGNLERARAVLSEQRGARLPTTGPNASFTRAQINTASLGFGGAGTGVGTGTGGTGTGGTGTGTGTGTGGAVTPQSFVFNSFKLGFDASYEVDLFGGITRAIEAARGDVQAAQAQLDASRVSVAAETARAYATACSNAQQRGVAEETVKLQQRTLGLTNTLFTAGRGTRRDVDRADVLLAQTQATIPGFEAERRASLYALAVLTGLPPEQIDAAANACKVPPTVRDILPIGDGAALIRRRPDVRQAERTLAADTARIGIATAELYPKISLLGSIGLNAQRGSQLFKSSAVTYSAGPLISWSFPNQTIARARIRQARAGADASLATFDGRVLTALQEVEQALARYSGALDRNAALRRAEASSSAAAKLSQLRFDYGADSFLLLIQAERDRADARAALAQSDAAVADAQISLFKALGGGWEDAPAPVRREPVVQP